MCQEPESCGTWRNENGDLHHGCIITEYCGTVAEYHGHPTTFNCPQGPKISRPKKTEEPVPARADEEIPVSLDELGRKSLFSLMGYSDLDIVDGVAGLLGGMMNTDERVHLSNCYGGIPDIVDQFKHEFESIDWKDLMNFKKDWEEIKESWNFFQNILKEIPVEINMCTSVVVDIVSWVIKLVHTINFGLFFKNLQAQGITLVMGFMAKGTDIGVAFASHDFYRLGQDVGGLVDRIIELGIGPDTA